MIVQMARLSRAVLMTGFLVLTPFWNPSASAQAAQAAPEPQAQPQTQTAQTPQQALVNLYQAAQQIIKDPASDYKAGASPQFPYPSYAQAQWDNSMAAHGNDLSTEERNQFVPCADYLNIAITDMEIGFVLQISQPADNSTAQQDMQQRYSDAPKEVEKCGSAYQLAQSEVVSAPANPPQQGTADASAANGSAIAGSAEEAALPGSIDWTPALNPLFAYLSNEWQRVVTDPKNKDWAADDAGNTLTLKLQPNQLPEVVSATGSRSSVFNNIMQNGELPVTTFPNGSTLRSVSIAPKFFVKPGTGRSRTRLKYYERDGIFKSYQAAQ
jgi:hypothetical protein